MFQKRPNHSKSNDYSSVAPPSHLNKRHKYDLCLDEKNWKENYNQDKVKKAPKLKSFANDDEDDVYWNEDDDDNMGLETNEKKNEDDDEEDPLDAYMAGIEQKVKQENEIKQKKTEKEEKEEVRLDIEEEDDEESYYRYMRENPNAGFNAPLGNISDEEEDLIQYDEDDNPILNKQKMKHIEPLPPIDHSSINYPSFEKNFYFEHEDIENLGASKVIELRKTLGINVMGVDPPKPCISFAHFGFDDQLIKAIIKAEYSQPTPIQSQAIPIALSGRDCLGIAKTGSGKTAAYLWPMLIHILDQPELKYGDGPIGLILAPTRELSQQIYAEAKKFAKVYKFKVVCCYGGGSKWEQSKDLQEGAEIVVATPGRMIDMIKCKATNLARVTMLVLDEADRMFDMGFGIQVRSICDHCRPDRQTLLFSATFKKKVEKLARDVLTDPIKVVQGELGMANEDVKQVVQIFSDGPKKWTWLTTRLVEFTSHGSVLIFVTKKANAEELATNLKNQNFDLVLIHGDINQIERNQAISFFKRQEIKIMVATDVAARGLDITHIKTVINYDVARDIDTHTHRIGRTGRAGDKSGIAYTLVTDKDKEFAGHLVRNLESANQIVPEELMKLAMQSNWFRKSRFKKGKAKRLNFGEAGSGYKVRPGLGLDKKLNLSSSSPLTSSYTSQIAATSSESKNSDRIAAMKAAFRAQFQSNFKASTDNLDSQINTKNLTSDEKSKKKSRWE